MSAHRGRPLTSLTVILGLWVSARAWEWSKWPDATRAAQAKVKEVHPQTSAPLQPAAIGSRLAFTPSDQPEIQRPRAGSLPVTPRVIGMERALPQTAFSFPRIAFSLASSNTATPTPHVPRQALPVHSEPQRDHWSLSAWSILRPNGGLNPAIPSGQLGGSQIGLRLVHHMIERPSGMGLNAYARVSTPVAGRSGREAALGLSAKVRTPFPLEIGIERRLSLSNTGDGGWTFVTSGGANDVKLAGRIHIDGYAQAGVVGRHRRDGFADGEVITSYHLPMRGKARIEPGIGLWGAVQPGLRRVDIGPALTIRPVIAGTRYRISGQWRARISGNARPDTGPALVIGADF